MAALCAPVIRGSRKPLVVDLISSKQEAAGVMVPIPAAPVAGNLFWALLCNTTIPNRDTEKKIFCI